MSAHAGLFVEGVSRSYRATPVVDRVDLTLAPGRILALVGESGAGKSTLLRLIAGLEPVDAGEIRLGPQRLSSPTRTEPPELRRTGLIFQDFALFPHMTARQNIAFGLKGLSRDATQDKVTAWLARLDLATRGDAFPHQLSGGEQQRVAIARALAPEPGAILMDEPFSGLDPALRDEVETIALAAIRESGPPALLVSHDARAAMEVADDLAVMRAGRIIQVGTPDEVYLRPCDAGVAAALGPVNRFRAEVAPPGLLDTLPGPVGGLVCVREEGVCLDPASHVRGEVIQVARSGAFHRLRLRSGALDLRATVPLKTVPETGSEVGLSLDNSLTFVFTQPDART